MRVPSLIPTFRRHEEGITICPLDVAVVSIVYHPPTNTQECTIESNVSQSRKGVTTRCWCEEWESEQSYSEYLFARKRHSLTSAPGAMPAFREAISTCLAAVSIPSRLGSSKPRRTPLWSSTMTP